MQLLLFGVLLCGIIIATAQDLKRREVDNWLNFFLLITGIITIVYTALFSNDWGLLLQGLFVVGLGFIAMHVFYMARIFAGGDAKLLFALSPYFVNETFFLTFIHFGFFILFLFFCGGIWGLCYSLVLFFKNFSETAKQFKHQLITCRVWWFILCGAILLGLSFVYHLLLVFGILVILFPFLFSFAKALEIVVMTKTISGKELREGDWLLDDITVGSKKIKATFDGVTKEELALLASKKKIRIRDGIPFVPGFFFAFLLYYFYADFILSYVFILL